MAREVYINQDECTGCSACVDIAPEVFKMNNDNLAEIFNSSGAPEDKIQEAISSCPVECIHWK
jgi:ferredoxin